MWTLLSQISLCFLVVFAMVAFFKSLLRERKELSSYEKELQDRNQQFENLKNALRSNNLKQVRDILKRYEQDEEFCNAAATAVKLAEALGVISEPSIVVPAHSDNAENHKKRRGRNLSGIIKRPFVHFFGRDFAGSA